MKLVVIIPALNEQATIADVIDRIPREIAGVERVDVIVINDGSTDDTKQAAIDAGAAVVSHRYNRGVGAAFRTGIGAALEAGADIVVNMDGDGQFNPADIPALIEPILAERAGMVTCSRFGKAEYVPEMPGIKKWGNRMMCRLINKICWNAKFTDVSCGYRAYSRRTAMRLTLFGDFTYTQESFIDLVGKGVHIVEVPLRVRGVRAVGKSRVAGNLWNYAKNSAAIILRAARDIRPLAFFGSIGVFFLVLGILCGGTVFGWWVATGHTAPIKSVLIGSAVFLILGFLMIMLALVADMLGRQRKILDGLLLQFAEMKYSRSVPTDAAAEPDRVVEHESDA